MKNRIRKLIESEGLTSTKFAEIIGTQRSAISHFLSGRNNPGYEVIVSILKKFDKINSDWLLLGKGEMYKKEQTRLQLPTDIKKEQKKDNTALFSTQNFIQKNKEIDKIIIFYDDSTFEVFKNNKDRNI